MSSAVSFLETTCSLWIARAGFGVEILRKAIIVVIINIGGGKGGAAAAFINRSMRETFRFLPDRKRIRRDKQTYISCERWSRRQPSSQTARRCVKFQTMPSIESYFILKLPLYTNERAGKKIETKLAAAGFWNGGLLLLCNKSIS